MRAGYENQTPPAPASGARKRILHVEAGRHMYGGAYQVLALLRNTRHEADHLLACAHGSAIGQMARKDGLQVREIGLTGDAGAGAWFALRRAIRDFRPDIVHVHSRRGADVWGVLAAIGKHVPLIITRRVDNHEPRWLAHLRYGKAARIVGISEKICEVLESEGVPRERLRCIRSGVDTDAFRPGGVRGYLADQFGIAADESVVVMAAQFIPRKGHATLLAALPEVLAHHPRTRFLLLGTGPLHEQVKTAAAPFGDRVLVPGFRDDFTRLLPACDVLAHPAEMEGLGVVLLQAAACGIPVVAGRAGGIPEIVRDGETGFLVTPGDAEALAGYLCQLLGDAALRRRMGAAARAFAECELSISATTEANMRLYDEVVRDLGAPPPTSDDSGPARPSLLRRATLRVVQSLASTVMPPAAWLLCKGLGALTWHFTSRRQVALRNLHLAFPDKPAGWHERIARRSTERMFEMFLVPLLGPWFTERERLRRFRITPEGRQILESHQDGMVILIPHTTLTESMVMVAGMARIPPATALYRPLDFKPADRYVRWARSRWGLTLHSRKEGLIEARAALARNETMAVLFDQNAQKAGSLVISFGRVCSATDLPGLLAAKMRKPVVLLYPRRTGFLRCEITVLPFDAGTTAATITQRSTLRLEEEMRRRDAACMDWLWAHQRWKLRDTWGEKLNLDQKKSYIDEGLKQLGLDTIPRNTPFSVRLPAEVDDARLVVPLLPRLRAGRPDVFWIVVAPSSICHELREGEHYDRLDPFSSPSRVPHVLSGLRDLWIDTHFCLYPGADVAQERRWCNARKVFGIDRSRQTNRKAVALWKAPEPLLEDDRYGELVNAFLEACGLHPAPNGCMDADVKDSKATG